MKKWIIWNVLLLVATGSVVAQAPDNVKASFKKLYAGAEDVEWNKSNGMYEAEFSDKNAGKIAVFSSSGKWVKTITFLDEDQVPAPVNKQLNDKFGEVYLDAAELVETSETKYYHVKLSTENGNYDIELEQSGKIIRETLEMPEEEEEYIDEEADF